MNLSFSSASQMESQLSTIRRQFEIHRGSLTMPSLRNMSRQRRLLSRPARPQQSFSSVWTTLFSSPWTQYFPSSGRCRWLFICSLSSLIAQTLQTSYSPSSSRYVPLTSHPRMISIKTYSILTTSRSQIPWISSGMAASTSSLTWARFSCLWWLR